MVKGKKKTTFLPFNTENSRRIATQKMVHEGDKPQKPSRPPKQQHSLETNESTAENMGHLSLQDPTNFPNHSHSDLTNPTFSPPLKPQEQALTNTPSYNSIVKGDVKPNPKKEKHSKPETPTNPENLSKHMPTSSNSNEHPRNVTQESLNSSDLPPAPKSVWNIPDPPLNPEPLSQASNWVRSAPPVSTPKPFGASLDPLTLNVPLEPLTVNVPSQSGATTETTVHTPSSATLNVDAPVFQPKSAHPIPEFVPQQVEIPVSTPETALEYVYDENTAHQPSYTEQIYPQDVPLANTMVAPEYYPPMATMMPYLAPTDPIAYTYPIPVSISNPAEVHHIPTEMPPNYPIPDLQTSTTTWQTQHMYHDDAIDPNRDPNRAHRGVYAQGMPARGYFNPHNQRYDARRNSGQTRYQDQRSFPTNARRDSRDSEASEHSSLNHRGPPRHQHGAQNDKRNSRLKNDTRQEYHGRSSNNNHNKNRDQNQIRPNEDYDKNQPLVYDPVEKLDDPPSASGEASHEQQPVQDQNHHEQIAESSNQSQHENSFDPDQSCGQPYSEVLGSSSSSSRNESKVSPDKHNWRNEPRGGSSRVSNPKDYRVDGDSRAKSKRDEMQRQPMLDYYWGLTADEAKNDEEFKHFVHHWEEYRKYTNVEEINSDLFTMDKDFSLAHCVAEDMRMGSGIAVTFKRDFKCQAELLQQRAMSGGLALLEQDGRYIYYLVTKKLSVGKPTYHTLWRSLKKMREHIVEKEVKKLALPRIGCGLDKLEWTKVKNMIQYLFAEVDIHINVCNFQQIEEQTQVSSPPTPKQFSSCKTVPVSYPVCDIESYTIIVFLSTETGHVSPVMQDLDKKFNFLKKFKDAQKKMSEIFVHEDKNYVLCGCIVRKTPTDLIDFVSLSKCVSAINKYNRQKGLNYVGFQPVSDKDYQEEDVNSRIITILINYLRKVDVYICGDNNVKRDE